MNRRFSSARDQGICRQFPIADWGFVIMHKLLTAIVSALMLAGALSAISGGSAVPTHSGVAIVGEGSSPLPILLSYNSSQLDVSSLPKP